MRAGILAVLLATAAGWLAVACRPSQPTDASTSSRARSEVGARLAQAPGGAPATGVPAAAAAGPGDPRGAARHYVRGKWLLLEGTLEGAIRELTLARRLDGTSRQVLRLLGDAFWAAGRRDEAAEVYQEAIRVGGDDIPCHYQLGVYHYLRDEIEAALRRFAAVDADPAAHGVLPHVVMSQFYQARCQDRLDQGEPAIGHYRRFAEMTGEYRSSFRVMPELLRLMREPSLIPVYVARVQSRQGRLSAAAETLRKAIDAHPDWVLGHTELTRVHLLAGRGEEAMAVCRQIVRRAPADRDALQLAAEVFAAMGEGEQFLLLVKEVLEANPDQEALKKFHAEMVKRFGPRAASRPAEPSAGQP